MFKHILIASLSLATSLAHAGAALTDMEVRWLKAAGPVLAYSQRIKLPIDIIVQPVARPNDVPMAMGFVDGRCKLVLSMRGNPDAEKVLDNVPEAERAVLMEAMAAHEVGHCWRYAQGVWNALPAGFEPAVGDQKIQQQRREEGYADLVALAWTQQQHPDHYRQVFAWLSTLRNEHTVPGGSHDTRAWVRLASDASVFKEAVTPFEQASSAWGQGLAADD